MNFHTIRVKTHDSTGANMMSTGLREGAPTAEWTIGLRAGGRQR